MLRVVLPDAEGRCVLLVLPAATGRGRLTGREATKGISYVWLTAVCLPSAVVVVPTAAAALVVLLVPFLIRWGPLHAARRRRGAPLGVNVIAVQTVGLLPLTSLPSSVAEPRSS